MNAPTLAGAFAAWASAQAVMAILFLVVYLSRQRERAFLLFACLCLALTLTDVAIAFMYAARTLDAWATAANAANACVALAAGLGIHFARSFDEPETARRHHMWWVYVGSSLFALAALTDSWNDRSTLHTVEVAVFGVRWDQVVVRPNAPGLLFYTCVVPVYLWILRSLVKARRMGNVSGRGLIVALTFGSAFVVNDILVAVAQVPSLYLTPFGFLMYGFGFALALLDRYERAASDLEVTAIELRNATDELTTSYMTLSRVQEELFRRRQLASVGELAGTIAHEVRNPLAIIRNAAASLRRRAAREDDRETLLAIVDEEIDRLNDLVTELLRFARPVDVERADVSIVDLVQGIREELPKEYSVELVVRDPNAEIVWADPTLLRLAVDNLVSNAIQAIPDGGTLTVRVGRRVADDDTALSELEVVDTGSGMDPDTAQRAFDPFFTTRPKGTGLGLPIVRRIAEAHDGQVEISSAPGGGTVVKLTLPLRLERVTRYPAVASPTAAEGG